MEQILRRAPLLIAALEAARDVDAPDWLINAGAIRDVVFDSLHDRPLRTPPRDVDLGFDPGDLSPERDAAVEAALRERAPDVPWEAKNQAAVHLSYPKRFGFESRRSTTQPRRSPRSRSRRPASASGCCPTTNRSSSPARARLS